MLLLTCGCGKVDSTKVKSDFEDKVNKSKSYLLSGTMEIMNNDDTFVYTVEASFLKDDYYKVRLVNQTNNHEQVILKNDDGVYVVTPSLNKSFKFQSEWPSNSSQSYLLTPLLNDVKIHIVPLPYGYRKSSRNGILDKTISGHDTGLPRSYMRSVPSL